MKCQNCNAELYKKWSKKYCNRSCSATFNNKKRTIKDEQKQKSKQSLKKYYDKVGRKHQKINDLYVCVCGVCKKQFLWRKYTKKLCSKLCQDALKRKVNKEIEKKYGGIWTRRKSRSKGEKLLAKKLISSGLHVLTNKRMFSGFDADIILPQFKLAIHWNGAWHWKPLITQELLNKIKQRDELRYNAIETAGYINLILIDHNFSSPEQASETFYRKLMYQLKVER